MSTTIVESRVHWVHTGIDAPYSFTITGFNELETHRGVAYSAELVHPDLGVVGRIANTGCGGSTTFDAYDRARFGAQQLEQFLTRSLQDGEPMDTADLGMETLLDEIINEAETVRFVAEMRTKGLFLVRSYLSREAASWGPARGAPLTYTRIVARHDRREQLVAKLADNPAERLDTGAYWQMFNGVEWTRLLGESPLTPEQSNARVRRAEQLAAEAPDPDIYRDTVPFDEQFYLSGKPSRRFTLTGDTTSLLNTDSWCPCPRRQSTVRFERWTSTSLEESGDVHAAKHCRRLVRID